MQAVEPTVVLAQTSSESKYNGNVACGDAEKNKPAGKQSSVLSQVTAMPRIFNPHTCNTSHWAAHLGFCWETMASVGYTILLSVSVPSMNGQEDKDRDTQSSKRRIISSICLADLPEPHMPLSIAFCIRVAPSKDIPQGAKSNAGPHDSSSSLRRGAYADFDHPCCSVKLTLTKMWHCEVS